MKFDIRSHADKLLTKGITTLQGAFPRHWAEHVRQDMMEAFWSAIQRPGGAVGRGPRRWYVEVHPQQRRGFVDLAMPAALVVITTATLRENRTSVF